jgi:hypothetical protein
MIREILMSITTTGSAGSATGETTSAEGFNGLLMAVYIPTGAPATTDWTFSDPAAGVTLFTLTNINTAGWYAPMIPGVTVAAGVAITGAGVLIPLMGTMKIALAQSDAGTYIVRLRIQRMKG